MNHRDYKTPDGQWFVRVCPSGLEHPGIVVILKRLNAITQRFALVQATNLDGFACDAEAPILADKLEDVHGSNPISDALRTGVLQ